MGVKMCSRSGCTEIMCDDLVFGRYLCRECLYELSQLTETWTLPTTEALTVARVEAFRESDVDSRRKLNSHDDLRKFIGL